MAVFALTSLHVAVNELAMSAWANQVEVNAEADELDVTTFTGGGYRQKIVGLGSFNVEVNGFQDFIAPAPGVSFPGTTATNDGALSTFTVAPMGDAVGNVAYFGQTRITNVSDISGAIGEAAAFKMSMVGTNRLVRGQMLDPLVARTTTGTGAVTAFTAPIVGQALHAAFHVHAVTGTGTITFVVATDNIVGFTTPITRITSQAFTGIGHQFASSVGALAGETHIRAGWTITGFTSVLFSVAAGAGAP